VLALASCALAACLLLHCGATFHVSHKSSQIVCRYWFTWKADGTRYMLYLAHSGCYLIDRKLKVSRCQMRFPLWTRDGVPTATAADVARWLAAFDAGAPPPLHPIAACGRTLPPCS
jgi:mRNA capping enzyme, catalytic domain